MYSSERGEHRIRIWDARGLEDEATLNIKDVENMMDGHIKPDYKVRTWNVLLPFSIKTSIRLDIESNFLKLFTYPMNTELKLRREGFGGGEKNCKRMSVYEERG